jgi:hypothetical protein
MLEGRHSTAPKRQGGHTTWVTRPSNRPRCTCQRVPLVSTAQYCPVPLTEFAKYSAARPHASRGLQSERAVTMNRARTCGHALCGTHSSVVATTTRHAPVVLRICCALASVQSPAMRASLSCAAPHYQCCRIQPLASAPPSTAHYPLIMPVSQHCAVTPPHRVPLKAGQ